MKTLRRSTTEFLLGLFLIVTLVHQSNTAGNKKSEPSWIGAKPAQTVGLAWQRYYVEAFVWPPSIKTGEPITVYVSIKDTNGISDYRLVIYRMGDENHSYYDVSGIQGHCFPLHTQNGDTISWGHQGGRPVEYRNGCLGYWQSGGITITNTSNWPSGLYRATIIHRGLQTDPNQNYVAPFVVRAQSPGNANKILFKYDLNTEQAYNFWGGGSFYSDSQDSTSMAIDSVIATDRPLPPSYGGNVYVTTKMFIPLLESFGDSMEYCNNIDIDSLGPQGFLNSYKMLVIWNHDEYWAPDERTYTETFKNIANHGNIGRFAANSCYRKVDWVGSPRGSKYLQLECLKLVYNDGREQWRKLLLSPNPEAKLLGEEYQIGFNTAPADSEPSDTVRKPSHWIFRGTSGLSTPGLPFGIGFNDGNSHGILGNEIENTQSDRNSVTYLLDTLASAWVKSDTGVTTHVPILHQMIYAEDTSTNSRIFAAGTENWWCGIDWRANQDVPNMRTITRNIFDHFSAKKYIGKVYSSLTNPVIWSSNTELDGFAQVPLGKYLKVTSTTITIDSTFSIDGTLEIGGNVTMGGAGTLKINPTGTVIVDGNSTLTIASGTTLQAQGGGIFTFGTSAYLAVNGRILAQGSSSNPITFTSSGTWYGLVLQSGSTGTVSYCNFNHATVGVSCNSSSPTINNNTFRNNYFGIYCNPCTPMIQSNDIQSSTNSGIYLTNASPNLQSNNFRANGNYGIWCHNYSSPTLINNTLAGNGSAGIYCDYYSSPSFGAPYVSGNNVVSANGAYGVQASNYSNPFLGLLPMGGGGYNSVFNNPSYDVSAMYGCTIQAQYNWWGVNPQFYSYQSTIDHSNSLPSNPNPGRPKIQAPGEGIPSLPIGPTTDSTFNLAFQDALVGKYDDAIALYLKVFNGAPPESFLARQSLVFLAEAYERSGKSDFISCLHSNITPRASVNQDLTVISRQLEAHWLTKGGRYADAISMFQALCADYSSNADVDKFATFNIGEIYELYLNDHAKAVEAFTLFRSKYPTDPLAPVAGLVMSSTASPFVPSQQKGGGTVATKDPNPAAFALEYNFPNPFNPSTQIRYSLPEAGKVSLMIYDVLGREVANLADGYQQAGRYSVAWNSTQNSGVPVSSGVYFARLRVTNDLGGVKFTKTTRLLLMK